MFQPFQCLFLILCNFFNFLSIFAIHGFELHVFVYLLSLFFLLPLFYVLAWNNCIRNEICLHLMLIIIKMASTKIASLAFEWLNWLNRDCFIWTMCIIVLAAKNSHDLVIAIQERSIRRFFVPAKKDWEKNQNHISQS